MNKPVLTTFQQEQFECYKRRREDGEPLQYILGTCNFMGLDLMVNPSVLIPRPETEQLVDAALKQLTLSFPNVADPAKDGTFVGNPIKILDLGTGSGNIAIALAKFVPGSKIVSVDVSAKALEVARANARAHLLESSIEFIHKDLNDYCAFIVNDKFDLIISNPPYIPTSQLSSLPQDVQEEPMRALDGGEDGLDFYRIIIKYTPFLLRSDACLMMEFGDACPAKGGGQQPQSDEIRAMIEKTKSFSNIEIIQDLAGRDRIIKAIL